MPKVLSLKKSSQAGPPKNQKSITQFFSNAPSSATQTYKTGVTNSINNEKDSAKRKATSPITLDSEDSDNCLETSSKPKHSECNSPKKQKTEIKKQLPNKENGYPNDVRSQSPKKVKPNSSKYSPQRAHGDLQSNIDVTLERSPLSLVKAENLQNHVIISDKSCVKTLFIEQSCKSPTKNINNENHINTEFGACRNWTPKKSPFKEFLCSPSKLESGKIQNIISPSKSGSTVKSLEFGADVGDMFGDEWDIDQFDESEVEDLDLTQMQRCEIMSVNNHGCRIELKLMNTNNKKTTCFVEGICLDTPLTSGDLISVLASRDAKGQFCVNNMSGLLVLRPDHLISSTSVVAGVFCKRKAVLQERWKGLDSGNAAMTIGIIIHELVQKALTQNITSIARLRSEADLIIKESVQMLYDAGLSEEEARSNIQTYIPPLAEFMMCYVASGTQQIIKDKHNWRGKIDKVLDIEENICCPQLGLKGKIDATLEVTIHERKGNQKAIAPLELKSGKASVSAEHRGQLVLYGMMLSLQRNEDPTQSLQKGLLLYLRDRVDLREVSCGYPERRDLIMLRNQLVQYLTRGPGEIDSEQLLDIEDASALLQQNLPEPVHHETACAKCPYLTICSLHLWHTDGPKVSEVHPLSKLQGQALGHLLPQHIKYFLHWTALLKMEERGQLMTSPLHALWTDSVENRSNRGTCASNLKLKSVKQSLNRFLHVFERSTELDKPSGPQENEFSIVSIENRPWIAAGVVTVANQKEIHIVLERDLSRRLNKHTQFHIDTYESYATTVQNLTNLGVLLEDSDRAERLRKIIIDKSPAEFERKLPRDVGRLGSKLMRTLNIEQQRAVLKSITAKDYALLQGLPGTGKTQTISVLIQMLVGLKQRVLVTAHTHSAVDNVLSRLPDTIKIIRLGSASRVAPSLLKCSEQAVISSCETPEHLERLYDSMEVVGVTCLGSAHAMLAKTTFDVCIVDEATQVLQCTVLRPLFAAKRFILVGDPDQLPPVVRSRAARRLGMEESLFHRLISKEATSTLQLQYRMNQQLTDIANKVAYNNKLKCANENVAQAKLDIDVKKLKLFADSTWLKAVLSPEAQNTALFLDVSNNTELKGVDMKTLANEEEARVVIAIVEALKMVGIKTVHIGVIAPYRDQVSLLRRCLTRHGVEVSTVDQFQGRDKSVIIYSCTRRDIDDRKVKEGEVLNDQRRLAVSVTRAKHKFILVGNSAALQRYTPLQRLINACTIIKLNQQILDALKTKYVL